MSGKNIIYFTWGFTGTPRAKVVITNDTRGDPPVLDSVFGIPTPNPFPYIYSTDEDGNLGDQYTLTVTPLVENPGIDIELPPALSATDTDYAPEN